MLHEEIFFADADHTRRLMLKAGLLGLCSVVTGCRNSPVGPTLTNEAVHIDLKSDNDFKVTLPDGRETTNLNELQKLLEDFSRDTESVEFYDIFLNIDPSLIAELESDRARASKETRETGFFYGRPIPFTNLYFRLQQHTGHLHDCIDEKVPHVNIAVTRYQGRGSIFNIHLAVWINEARKLCGAYWLTGELFPKPNEPCWKDCDDFENLVKKGLAAAGIVLGVVVLALVVKYLAAALFLRVGIAVLAI